MERPSDIPSAGYSVTLDDGAVTVWLSRPVKIDAEEAWSVTLRPATGADLRHMVAGGDGMELGQIMDLAGRLCGLLPGQMDALPARDAMALQGVASLFFEGS
ncbi:MAG: phage tail assembly protein [bacterium]|nr:phage tail assembly protein [bacterium]